MSADPGSAASRARGTPGVDAQKPPLEEADSALRVGAGRYTVDIISTEAGLFAIAGNGVGRKPVTAEIGPVVVAAVLELADVVDERTAWETQAWPLVVP